MSPKIVTNIVSNLTLRLSFDGTWRAFRTCAEAGAAVLEYEQSSMIDNGCTQAWTTVPRPRCRPAWRGSPCAPRRDALIPPLHTQGASSHLTLTRNRRKLWPRLLPPQ